MCLHDCPCHFYETDPRLNGGRCYCRCVISRKNLEQLLRNMVTGRSRAKSVIAIGHVWISAAYSANYEFGREVLGGAVS